MSVSYTKNELAFELSTKLNISAVQARRAAEEVIGCIIRAFVRREKVVFRDFGCFDVRVRKARVGRNPRQPKQTYRVPPKHVIRFRAGRELDQMLNNHA